MLFRKLSRGKSSPASFFRGIYHFPQEDKQKPPSWECVFPLAWITEFAKVNAMPKRKVRGI
jgi:hypothetical protein